MLVVVLVLENPDRFIVRLTEQISSIGLFAVTESQCTEDEHDETRTIPNFGRRVQARAHCGLDSSKIYELKNSRTQELKKNQQSRAEVRIPAFLHSRVLEYLSSYLARVICLLTQTHVRSDSTL